MVVYIFRHGETDYSQGKVSLSEANDLTLGGIATVCSSAMNLASRLNNQRGSVLIESSPFGRCLHTSKLIANILKASEINVRKVNPDEQLREVDNFDWNVFFPLVSGGKIIYEGEEAVIDKNLTNPHNLSHSSYFRKDLMHKLPGEVTRNLPERILKKIKSCEAYHSVVNRINSKLLSIPEGDTTILCTHDGPIGDLLMEVTGRDDAYLQRGMYFEVQRKGNILIPKIVQENSIGY